MEGYLANCVSDNSVIIIDGIHSDKNNMELWQLMKKNEKVRVTMDLYEPGIAIFNEKLFKKHYIVSF